MVKLSTSIAIAVLATSALAIPVKDAKLEAEKAKLQKNINSIDTVEGLRGDRMTVGGKKRLDGKKADYQKKISEINKKEGLTTSAKPKPKTSTQKKAPKKKFAKLEAEKAKLQKNVNAIDTVEGLRGDKMTVGGRKKLDSKKAKLQSQIGAINTVEGLNSREPEPEPKKFAKLEAAKSRIQNGINRIKKLETSRGDKMTIGGKKRLDAKMHKMEGKVSAINTVEGLNRREPEPKKFAKLEAAKSRIQNGINRIKKLETSRGDKMTIGGKKRLDAKMHKMEGKVSAINTVEGLNRREPEPKKFAKLEAAKSRIQNGINRIKKLETSRGDKMTIGGKKRLDAKMHKMENKVSAINTVEGLNRREFEIDFEERDFDDFEEREFDDIEERGFEDYELDMLD